MTSDESVESAPQESECPECGFEMERRELTGATKCAGEWRESTTVKDFCFSCGIRSRVSKEIGGPIDGV